METKSVELRVAGLDCENEAAQIERGLAGRAGIVRVETFPKSAKVRVEYDPGKRDDAQIAKDLAELGFPVQRGAADGPAWWRSSKLVSSVASGVLLLVSWIVGRLDLALPALALSIAAMVVGGYFFGREAVEKLLRRRIGIELLMSVAAIGAAVLGETFEGAMLVFLYSISEAAEGFTEEKTRAAVRALMKLAPKVARVKRDGTESEIPVEDVRVGDWMIVRPGESIPTDGVVRAGSSSVDQAPVTGESVPVPKAPTDVVFAGTINAEGVLEVEATRGASENTLARIIHMVEEAQEKKGEQQRFVERFGNAYSPIVLLAGLAFGVVLAAATDATAGIAASRAIVLVVAAAPCALAISIPISMVAALGSGARGGVLIKGGVILERLAAIDVVMLDKTGTLTHGKPRVAEVTVLPGSPPEREAITVAAALEHRSEHPVARAIVAHARELGLVVPDADDVKAIPGMGIRGRVGDREVFVGRPELFAETLGLDPAPFADAVRRQSEAGRTIVLAGDARGVWMVIGAADTLREEAREAVRALHGLSISV